MPLTTATINAMVDAICNASAFAVSALTISLHTSDPGSDGSNEVTGGSYSRQSATFGSAASSRSIANTVAINFADMPSATVTHIGIWDSTTFRGGEALSSSQVVGAGQTLTMAIGALVISFTSGGISTYAANALLNALCRNTSFSVTNPYTSVHTGDPGDNGANEATGGSYARQLVSYGVASSGQAASDTLERYGPMPSATLTHGGIWDASTSGNFLGGSALSASKTVASGEFAEFAIGALTVG